MDCAEEIKEGKNGRDLLLPDVNDGVILALSVAICNSDKTLVVLDLLKDKVEETISEAKADESGNAVNECGNVDVEISTIAEVDNVVCTKSDSDLTEDSEADVDCIKSDEDPVEDSDVVNNFLSMDMSIRDEDDIIDGRGGVKDGVAVCLLPTSAFLLSLSGNGLSVNTYHAIIPRPSSSESLPESMLCCRTLEKSEICLN